MRPQQDGKSDRTDAANLAEASAKSPAGSARTMRLRRRALLATLVLCCAALLLYSPWSRRNFPLLGALFGQPGAADASADALRDIGLRNVRSFIVPNEKLGDIFVVQGQAVNNGATPKERIAVEVMLLGAQGQVLASKQRFGGNTLSEFQLQVQTEEEINDGLDSKMGVLTSNTGLKTGDFTPFMVVFRHAGQAKGFDVKVIDARVP